MPYTNQTITINYTYARTLLNETGFESWEIVLPKLPIPMSIFQREKFSKRSDSAYLPANWFCVY